MQVRIEDVSPVEKKLIVEIPWETVSARLGEAYRELSKNVRLKGFRPGKVPRPVLEQMYGPRVNADVAVQLVRESFFTANSQHKLAAVAEPRVEDGGQIKKGQPFAFAAIVEVKGAVEFKDHEGLPLERRKLAIADEAVDAAVEQLRKAHTELVPIEGRTATEPSDVVHAKIVGTIGEHPVNQPSFAIDLDDKERDPLPGLQAALIGLPIDAKDHEIELVIPEDHADENLKGRSAKLTVTVLEARAKQVPALDDEFAKDTGKAETLEALRATLRKDLEDRETDVIKRELRAQAVRELVKRNQIPVAGSLVERAIEIQYNRMRQMLGMPPEREGESALSPQLRDSMRASGADEVRAQLLLEAIAEKESVDVTDAELDAHVAAAAKARNVPVARLRAEWDRDGKLDNARWQLRQDKVVDTLVARAAVTEVEKLTQPVEAQDAPELDEPAGHGHVHDENCGHDH